MSKDVEQVDGYLVCKRMTESLREEIKRLRKSAEDWHDLAVGAESRAEALRKALTSSCDEQRALFRAEGSAPCEAAIEVQALRTENEALRAALFDVVDDLEHYVKHEYPHRETYPSSMRRYLRDMEPVNKARAILRGEVE